MKTKIAFISDHASPLAVLGGVDSGGQNVYVDQLTKALTNYGYEIDIFTRWDNKDIPETIDCKNNIRVINVQAGPKKFVKKEQLFKYMNQFERNILKFITDEKEEYSLIHANFFMSGMVAMKIREKLGIPFVITFHALGKVRREYQGKADKFTNERFSIEETIIKQADKIIAECPQDREDLIFMYGANQDKIRIVPCGYNPAEFFPMDKKLARMTINLPQDETIILQLGRMVKRKGIENVIRAISYIKKKKKQKIRLVIVGGNSKKPNEKQTPEIGRLSRLAKKLKIEEQITFVGSKNREELKHYYNAADIFVSTPWYEPFGITPLESMATATPVIGSNVGGIKFTVVDGKTGYLVPPKDFKALGEKLFYLLNDKEKIERFGNNALDRVRKFFTWEVVAQQMIQVYQETIFGSRSTFAEYEKQASIVLENLNGAILTLNETKHKLTSALLETARIISKSILKNKKVIAAGNGGSAAEAQHFTAELVGRFIVQERQALPAISIVNDSATMTAVSNDYGFENVFKRQIEALGNEGDIFLGISTSGNSKNLVEAFKSAAEKNIIRVGLLGNDGGEMLEHSDLALVVPTSNTQRIQETHLNIIHILCELIEHRLYGLKDESIYNANGNSNKQHNNGATNNQLVKRVIKLKESE